jgi:putative phosphonate catabolism associated alcohol dehydrogenase
VTTSVRSLVWLGADRFELRTVDAPTPGAGELLVEVHLATVCSSDLHTVTGRRLGPHPSVLGHEAVGRVVATGDDERRTVDGRPVRVGDRIVWGVTDSCGTCDRCRRGLSAKCRRLRKVGHEPSDGSWPLSGDYSTHVVLPPGVAVVHVPDEVADAAAAPAACALATAVGAVDALGEVAGRRAGVWGLGLMGLSACVALRAAGAATVTGLDPETGRHPAALRLGADAVAAPGEGLPGPFDVVVEASGVPAAVSAAVEALDVGGHLALVGSVAPAGNVDVDPERLVRRLHTVVGVHNYEPHHLLAAVGLLRGSGDQLAELVAPPVGLGDLPEVLRAPAEGHLRRSVDPRR